MIADFPAHNDNSASFKFKINIAGRIRKVGEKIVKIMVPLKYSSNFWRTLEMPFITCEINLILTCSANCFIIDGPVENQVPTFIITDTKLYVPVVTLSIKQNYSNNWNQVLKEQLTRININQRWQYRNETSI